MPIVSLSSTAVPRVPTQYVYVGGVLDQTLVCEVINIGRDGATARFTATALSLDSDKFTEFTNEIVVYAGYDGDPLDRPLFRGFVDTSKSDYRTSNVTLVARSSLSWLRDRSVNVRPEYTLTDDAARSFAIGTEQRFPDANPFKSHEFEAQIAQPWDILNYFAGLSLDDFWNDAIEFYFDPSLTPLEPIESTTKRFGYSGGSVVLEELTVSKSPIPEQVFRMAKWGQAMDYIQEAYSGLRFVEVFTAEKSIVFVTTNGALGTMYSTVGYGNIDWRELGANITELNVDSGGELINRTVGYGSPAGCAVTLMSETADESEVGTFLDGLIPDWVIFDSLEQPTGNTTGLIGASAYDYEAREYGTPVEGYQRAFKVIADPNYGKSVPAYEFVGRRWRLPNWFNTMEFQHAGDIFIEPVNGAGISWQVFVEMPDFDGLEYKYRWNYVPQASFDPKTRTVTLDQVYTHPAIDYDPLTDLYVLDPANVKLARVAVTFTFLHNEYAMVADTFLTAGSVLDDSRRNAIETGVPLVFDRPDFQFLQLTNLTKPLRAWYLEAVPLSPDDTHGGYVYQQAVTEGAVEKTYSQLVVGVIVDEETPVLSYTADDTPPDFNPFPDDLLAPFDEPEIIRDDTDTLWDCVARVNAAVAVRPRSFMVQTPTIAECNIGMRCALENLTNYSYDDDVIDTISYDLRRGFMAVETTNKPSEAMVRSLISAGAPANG